MNKNPKNQAIFGTPSDCEFYKNVVPYRWTNGSNKVFSIQVAQQITVSPRSDPEK